MCVCACVCVLVLCVFACVHFMVCLHACVLAFAGVGVRVCMALYQCMPLWCALLQVVSRDSPSPPGTGAGADAGTVIGAARFLPLVPVHDSGNTLTENAAPEVAQQAGGV